MTTAFILDIIPTRMREMGFGGNYHVEHHTVLVEGSSSITLSAWNAWAWFPSESITAAMKVSVESNFGCLTNVGTELTERQYEHTGKITIRNLEAVATYLTIIVATPHH